ncbi:MAG: bifunctional DNA-formamidopyrimidine glycosylase/DNA-(apurinic or apyrimidinic site) lyase [Candidatus Riflebacteria bacterium]|nr:bifunctional DNA-formamidopyrimidine glycosylase/DNA-(apurinic or apyrimidinic site) lyase [Candidatus Riflebacteria bacterium]
MPELPEVEALTRALRPWLEGRCLLSFEPRRGGLRRPFPAGAASLVVGRPIRRVWRRAKYLLFEFDGEPARPGRSGRGAPPSVAAGGRFPHRGGRIQLVFHLGMTGHLRVCPAPEPLDRHDHLVCSLVGGFHLRFNDPRRFGQVFLHCTTAAAPEAPELARLGPEPLDPAFTARVLRGRLAPRAGPVKTVLLDQAVVAGLGNIYATEALFVAGIHPVIPASRLTAEQVARLHRAIRAVLRRALAVGSTVPPEVPVPAADGVTSAADGVAPVIDGVTSAAEGPLPRAAYPAAAPGEMTPADVREETTFFPFPFLVYGRDGQPCRRCRAGTIERMVQAGRSTFFCPRCQPAPRQRGKSA